MLLRQLKWALAIILFAFVGFDFVREFRLRKTEKQKRQFAGQSKAQKTANKAIQWEPQTDNNVR